MALQQENKAKWLVVHPLDDVAELKRSSEGLGPMKLTRTARWSLRALRVYLVVMAALTLYRVVATAGLLGRQ